MLKYRNTLLWILWAVFTVTLITYYVTTIRNKDADKAVFLPGKTSDGHYQIERACHTCHGDSFTNADVIQEACMNCHGDALKEAKDKHPKSKFTDPRNADRVAILDARNCATCHVEHRPEITLEMGLTLPLDYCHLCHDDIADDRPSHAGMAFDTCASAGCHNFHDNQALYEDFLVKHLHQPDHLEKPGTFPKPNLGEIAVLITDYPIDRYPLQKLGIEDHDAPAPIQFHQDTVQDWFETAHAQSGVNCTACHNQMEGDTFTWTDKPDHTACKTCHVDEVNHFLMGRHGMRLDEEKLNRRLSPMTPAMARLPMKKKTMDKELGCNSCHDAHRYDIKQAAVESCLGCHNDEHSLAYIDSPHHELWKKELSGELPEGSGVSCATCHMPRLEKEYNWGEFYHTLVQHNQSDTMRPNEKMIRPVCMTCHSLGFSIDSLADREVINTNFRTEPSIHIESMNMAEKRMIEAGEKKKAIRARAQEEEQAQKQEDSEE